MGDSPHLSQRLAGEPHDIDDELDLLSSGRHVNFQTSTARRHPRQRAVFSLDFLRLVRSMIVDQFVTL
jgi:hypothetical protein